MTGNTIEWAEDSGIVTLTFNDPAQSVNTMNLAYVTSFGEALGRLAAMGDTLSGVVISSGKKTFFAGGDLRDLLAATPADSAEFSAFTTTIKGQLRSLESLGVPVVAAINGTALGGVWSWRWPVIIGSHWTIPGSGSGCPRSHSVCCPVPAASCVPSGCSASTPR